MTKMVQVFLPNQEQAELSAECLKFEIKSNCFVVKFKEGDYIGTTIFPSGCMIRLWEEDEEAY